MGHKNSKSSNSMPLNSSASIPTTIVSNIGHGIEQNQTSSSIRPTQDRIIENFIVIWLDANIKESDSDCQNSITRLRSIVNTIKVFLDPDECVCFLTGITDEKVFLIISGSLGQEVVPMVEKMDQLDSIYVFCNNRTKHEVWAKTYKKVKGVFNQIQTICDRLKLDTKQCSNDMMTISIFSQLDSSEISLNRLDQSFMYSQLLKEMLLEIKHDIKEKQEFVEFCRIQYSGNPSEMAIINEFERDYHLHTPIWWYTRECFTYLMLNSALRKMDIEIIIKMGFFMRDLHEQIEDLYAKASKDKSTLTVYRGQCMMQPEFEKMRRSEGALLSFNNFLSTSTDREVSLGFAKRSLVNASSKGILFKMHIDRTNTATSFAFLDKVSYFSSQEKEVLFSTHTVFRIGTVKSIEDGLWQVTLTIVRDNDQQLKRLTEQMRTETSGLTGWHRLGRLMIAMGELEQAEKVYKVLLESTPNTESQQIADLHHQLGFISKDKGDLVTALSYYQKTLEVQEKFLAADHPLLATTYINIGEVYREKGEHSNALSFYKKALDIQQKSLPPNHLSLATTFNCIGLIHRDMGDYPTALSFYNKTLDIQKITLSENHPSLATTFNCIGAVHDSMGDYKNALLFYEKTLDIQKNSLPANHPSFATTYNNIGAVHDSMGDCYAALLFYKMTLEIEQKCLPDNHPSLATTYNNMAMAFEGIDQYKAAVQCAERAVSIGSQALGPGHPQVHRYRIYLDRIRQHL